MSDFILSSVFQQARKEGWDFELRDFASQIAWYQAQTIVSFERRDIPLAKVCSAHGKRIYKGVYEDFKFEAMADAGGIAVPVSRVDIKRMQEIAETRANYSGLKKKATA